MCMSVNGCLSWCSPAIDLRPAPGVHPTSRLKSVWIGSSAIQINHRGKKINGTCICCKIHIQILLKYLPLVFSVTLSSFPRMTKDKSLSRHQKRGCVRFNRNLHALGEGGILAAEKRSCSEFYFFLVKAFKDKF